MHKFAGFLGSISLLLAACTTTTTSSKGAQSDSSTASGTISGAATGSIVGATVVSVGSPTQSDVFSISIIASQAESDIVVASPVGAESFTFELVVGLSSVPESSTTITDGDSRIGSEFASIISYTTGGGDTSGSYAAGTSSTDPTASLAISITSVEPGESSGTSTEYVVHGSVDATMAGAVEAPTGAEQTGPIVVHLTF